jgi:hypothetical protein
MIARAVIIFPMINLNMLQSLFIWEILKLHHAMLDDMKLVLYLN